MMFSTSQSQNLESKKITIGVLMGGRSIEREVSLNSGRTVCDHLDTICYTIIPLFQCQSGKLFILPWRFLHRGKIADFEHRLAQEAQHLAWDDLKGMIDLMYIALHGRYGEDGSVQGFLEILHIPYVGSKVFASALGMNKSLQKTFLAARGIKTPESITLTPYQIGSFLSCPDELVALLKSNSLTYPLFVKPVQEGSSLGVSRVDSLHDVIKAVDYASSIAVVKKQSVIIERAIIGLEFSCIVIFDYLNGVYQALPPTEIVIESGKNFFDYEQKYMPGRATKYTPARCSQDVIEKIKACSIQVVQALGFMNLARIDGFVDFSGSVVITDPNSFSGLAPSSYAFLQAAEIGMNHGQLINHLIKTELHAYGLLDRVTHNKIHQESRVIIKKERIGVIFGGTSHEKEISLESGRNVMYKLSPCKYEVVPVFFNKDSNLFIIPEALVVRNTTKEIEDCLTPEMHITWASLPERFDFVFIALHGGFGENGSLQGALEMLDVPYNGSSVLASALCINKHATNEFLKSRGFYVPDNYLVSCESWHNSIKNNSSIQPSFEFPCIVKPHDDGCSVMISKVHDVDELHHALDTVFSSGKKYALIEEFVCGTELTVGVIGNDTIVALPPSQSIAQGSVLTIEEKFLPGAGENQTPALLPHDSLVFVQNSVMQVYQAVGCKGYCRIDCFYQTAEQSPTKKERVIIIEINTLPGLTPATCLFHQAGEIGIKPQDFIDLIVQLGFENHRQKPICSENYPTLFKQLSDKSSFTLINT